MVEDKLLSIKVSVKDTGIGMSQTDVANIFRPFYRSTSAKSRSLNQSGNGVGLSICRKICKCLGGNLTVRSNLGNGSTFTFTMDASFTQQNSSDEMARVFGKQVKPTSRNN